VATSGNQHGVISMRALVFEGPGRIVVKEVEDPQLLETEDAIVTVTI
jgi:hypothetical protein